MPGARSSRAAGLTPPRAARRRNAPGELFYADHPSRPFHARQATLRRHSLSPNASRRRWRGCFRKNRNPNALRRPIFGASNRPFATENRPGRVVKPLNHEKFSATPSDDKQSAPASAAARPRGKPASGRQPDRPRLRSRTLPHTAGRGGRLGAGAPPPLRRVRGAARGRRRPHPATGESGRRVEAAAKNSTADCRRTPPRCATPRSLPGGGPRLTLRRRFRWRDPWVTVEGSIGRDSVECRIRSVDTLRQVVHRVPRRFLFIRLGHESPPANRSSSNPHTRIVYTEYVRIER